MAFLYSWLDQPQTNHLSSKWLFIKYLLLLLISIDVMICLTFIPVVLQYINADSNRDDLGGASAIVASVYSTIYLVFAVIANVVGFLAVHRQTYRLMISYAIANILVVISISICLEKWNRPLKTWFLLNCVIVCLTLLLSLIVRRIGKPAGPAIVNSVDLDDVLYSRDFV